MSRLGRPLGVLGLLGLLALASACGADDGPVGVPATSPSAADRIRCQDLLAALPATLAGQTGRPTRPSDVLGAAWGSPAIVLRCGGRFPVPNTAICTEVNGVGWYVPDSALDGQPQTVVVTTIGRSPGVRVSVPSAYGAPASVMVGLARSIRTTSKVDFPCS